ncbi:amino acid permease 2 [Actinidia rufa]|uniref:Amino acid permease 2 n=1 Tax=Actinidia rufa TaxID=165716 RepID=A0A7J0DL87_9ERIC|nr:amino acid permease 2 [Actinidia rufa]
MGENAATKNHHLSHQVFDLSLGAAPPSGSKCFDDDGRLKRTGTVWTASAHIITAVIGSGVLSLAWATAQLGWIAGPTVMFLFSFVTYYTSTLLAACYRSGDPVTGKRNYTYMDAVQSNLGGVKVKVCGLIQYLNLFGVAIGYTIAASISMMAIKRSNCFHESGGKNPCKISSTPYMIMFGVAEILFSQIPDFDQISWLSMVAAVMSFTYSSIGLGLGLAKVAEAGKVRGSLTGISIGVGNVTQTQKIWRSFQALGDIAFAYSYSLILIEIQDTVKSPPSESKTMKKASLISVTVTTLFYMLCGCFGYAAFGDLSPETSSPDSASTTPIGSFDIANAAIVIHLVRRIPSLLPTLIRLNLFRLVWRTIFVIATTVISMLMPFFNDVVGILGAFGFWPLTVYFPVEMYIAQKKIPKWSTRWLCLQILSVACLIISIAAAAGSFAGVVTDLKSYKPFKTSY